MKATKLETYMLRKEKVNQFIDKPGLLLCLRRNVDLEAVYKYQ